MPIPSTPSLQLQSGIQILNPVPIDVYYGPYNSIASANSSVPSSVRSISGSTGLLVGKTVAINDGVLPIYEAWWVGGISNSNLVPKLAKYKKYVALLTSDDTALTPLVLENEIGGISWVRGGVGVYTGTGSLPVFKVFCLVSPYIGIVSTIINQDANTIVLTTITENGEGTDNALFSSSIEIRVYN